MNALPPLPFVPLDSLHPGDELRIVRCEGPPLIGTFEGFDLDGMGEMLLRLSVSGGTQLLRCREIAWQRGVSCVQRIQTVVDAEYWDTRVFDSIWQGDSKVVLS